MSCGSACVPVTGSMAPRRERRVRKGIRRRARSESEEDDGAAEELETQGAEVMAAAFARSEGVPPRKRLGVGVGGGRGGNKLSFADEEEAEGTASRIKKRRGRLGESLVHGDDGGSMLAQSAAAQRRSLGREMASHLSSAGEYTAERLRQLREANRRNTEALAEVSMRGTFKPEGTGSVVATQENRGDRDERGVAVQEKEEEGGAPATTIPTRAEIEAARSDRAKRRRRGEVPAVVPVHGGPGLGRRSGDLSSDEDDGDERVAFKFYEDDRPTRPDVAADVGDLGVGPAPASGGFDLRSRADAAANRLARAAAEMEASEGSRDGELNRLRARLEDAEDRGRVAAGKLEVARERYEYLQLTRRYFADLCECLQEKAPIIEECEERAEEAERRAAGGLRWRLGAARSIHFGALQAGVLLAMATAAAGDPGPEGRARIREEVVRARADLLERHLGGGDAPGGVEGEREAMDAVLTWQAEGYDSHLSGGLAEDFLRAEPGPPPPVVAGRKEVEEILEFSHEICRDASEEFCSLDLIARRIEDFKHRARAAYFQAYVPESLPQLVSPYVRLELLRWDPLRPAQRQSPGSGDPGAREKPLESMGWHRALARYGRPGRGGEKGKPDPDASLLGVLVDKLALPRLRFLVQECWDPTSEPQSRVLRRAVSEAAAAAPDGSEALTEVILLVKNGLHASLEGCSVPLWPDRVAGLVPGCRGFVAHAVRRAAGAFAGALLFDGLLDRPTITKLAVQGIFCGKLLPYLRTLTRSDPESLARILCRLCGSVPTAWRQSGMEELKPLLDFACDCRRNWQGNEKMAGVSGELGKLLQSMGRGA